MPGLVPVIQNIALLMAGALLFDLLTSQQKGAERPTVVRMGVLGTSMGILGIVVMMTPWHVTGGVAFDTRSVILGISGLFFGFIPTVIVVIMTASFRVFQGGAGAWTGVLVILVSALIGIVWRRVRYNDVEDRPWRELFIFGLAVHVVMLAMMFTLPREIAFSVLSRIWLPVLLIYPAGTALLGSLIVRRLRNDRTQRALAKSEKSHRILLETATEGMWSMDADHKTTFVNRSMADMLGYEIHEMMGRPVEDFFFQTDQEFHVQKMQERHEGKNEVYERRFRRQDGSELWTLVSANALQDDQGSFARSFAMFTDITERKRIEEQLKRSNRYLKAVLDNMPSMIGYWDKDLRNLFANHAYLNWFGCDPGWILGKHIREVIGEERYSLNLPYIEGVMRGEVQTFERTIPSPCGHSFLHSIASYIPDIVDGEVHGFYAMVTDVTPLKNSEIELKFLLHEKDILLREIHHRVKNNLQIVHSLLSLQSDSLDGQEPINVLRDSQARIMSMALVHDQLYHSSSMGIVDVGEYIKELFAKIQMAYGGRCIVNTTLDIPGVGLALDQAIPFGLIVSELVTNAFKHAFKDCTQGTISIRVEVDGDRAVFLLKDSGPGIPPTLKLDESPSLGLKIVSLLVDQLHGTLSMESSDGFSVRVEFPLR
ncbi:MAG: two-component hybrid sensor and [Desulfovibrionaceae bacterium]|nr:MAG: two-component hybrid sensor and [Desulfovibrionaceae bacterium]